jgi:hypothetical protein
LGAGSRIRRNRGSNRGLALAFAALLTPGAVLACILALWRLAADLSWTKQFAIASGLFSHWQVWMFAAAILQLGSYLLNRYGRGSDSAVF